MLPEANLKQIAPYTGNTYVIIRFMTEGRTLVPADPYHRLASVSLPICISSRKKTVRTCKVNIGSQIRDVLEPPADLQFLDNLPPADLCFLANLIWPPKIITVQVLISNVEKAS